MEKRRGKLEDRGRDLLLFNYITLVRLLPGGGGVAVREIDCERSQRPPWWANTGRGAQC